MSQHTSRPGYGSAFLRFFLLLPALWILIQLPETLDYWDDPNASLLPSRGTMPFWGNYAILVITLLEIFLLVWAFILRRKATLRASTISLHKALAWFTVGGLALWTLALAASIWIIVRPEPEESALGRAVPEFTYDLIFALAAIGTIVVLVKDLRALSKKASTLGDEGAI